MSISKLRGNHVAVKRTQLIFDRVVTQQN